MQTSNKMIATALALCAPFTMQCTGADVSSAQPAAEDESFVQQVQALKAQNDTNGIEELYRAKFGNSNPAPSQSVQPADDLQAHVKAGVNYTSQFSVTLAPYASPFCDTGAYCNAIAYTKSVLRNAGQEISLVALTPTADGEIQGIPNTYPDPVAAIVQYDDDWFRATGELSSKTKQYRLSIMAFNDDKRGLGLSSQIQYRVPTSGWYQIVVFPYDQNSWGRVQVRIFKNDSVTDRELTASTIIGGIKVQPSANIVIASGSYVIGGNIDPRLWVFNFSSRTGYFSDDRTAAGLTSLPFLMNSDNTPLYVPGYGVDSGYSLGNRILGDNRNNPDFQSVRFSGWSQ